jgi:hypothetical protein
MKVRPTSILCRHEKNNWSVTLYEDGDIVVCSLFKRRINIGHLITQDVDYCLWLPKYVQSMINEAKALYHDTRNSK